MNFDKHSYPEEILIHLYRALVKPRMIEEKMLVLLRQGKIGKWFSGIGQEAVAVGVTEALASGDYILPLHRNLGVFTSRGIPFQKLFAQWQGKGSGFTQGRDRSFHFGSIEHNIIGMISHLGAMNGVADGLALAEKLNGQTGVACVFSGEGGTSEGDFHEALNLAAVWDLPVLFVVENNGYGLSTPTRDQFRCKSVADKGIGYGIKSKTIDGNNILEVFNEVNRRVKSMRQKPAPFLLECKTFRMRGHEEASGTKYVPNDLMESWKKKDPLDNFQRYLLKEGVLTESMIESIREEFKSEIETSIKYVESESEVVADNDRELGDVFKLHEFVEVVPSGEKMKMRFVDAISQGLKQAMELDEETILIGQDIAEYGGVFKISQGFLEEFGAERIRNTPICESAVIGAAMGLAIAGKKPIVEMQFADFVSCGFNQVVNNLAKTHYRWGQSLNVTIRMPTGAGVNAGPFHSQSNEAWFFHVPGLKIFYPSNPTDAKGLLMAAIQDPNPVLFFEHKALYRSLEEEVPVEAFNIEPGKAKLIRTGEDVSIISYGMGVHWASQICDSLEIDADILDLRTLIPWDKEAVEQSVKKTGRVLILHEDTLTGGIGGEIAAWIGENCFEWLDAPVKRCGSMDTPVPMSNNLEKSFLASSELPRILKELLEY